MMKYNYNPEVTKDFRLYQKGILKDFGAWKLMSAEEKTAFAAITRECELERFVRQMFDLHIMKKEGI